MAVEFAQEYAIETAQEEAALEEEARASS